MKCQRCPKQATLHITEVLGEDRFEEVHLCEDCAKKYLYEPQQKKVAKAGQAGAGEADDGRPGRHTLRRVRADVRGVPQPRPVRLPARLRRVQGRTCCR